MMRRIHVGNIEIENKIESDLREIDTVMPNIHTVTVEYSKSDHSLDIFQTQINNIQ
jgi:hypothetical protein